MKTLALVGKGLAALFALNFVALAATGGVLAAKGMLTREKVTKVVAVLRAAPAVEAPPQPADTAPASRPAELVPAPVTLADRERVVALLRAQFDKEIDDIRQRSSAVDRARQKLESDRAAFEAERQTFRASLDATTRARRQAGMRETLKTYAALKPDRIKALAAPLSDEDLTEVLVGLEARLRAKVIDEFKTPEELARIQKVLSMIRAGTGGKPVAGAAPAPETP
jgi:flagellar motility protein MotE (MotC chaperone)